MSKHRMVDGRLLQMNKKYGQLKQNRSQQWKDDYAMDEAGQFLEKLKRGVRSPDAVWNTLERNSELAQRIGITEMQEFDNDEHTHV